jgi:nitroreductase
MSKTHVGGIRTVDLFATVEARHSVREFAPREVEPGELEQILMAASRAPSAGNLQAYQIVLVRAPGRRQALARAAHGQAFVANAPVVLVFCADPARSAGRYGRRGAELFAVQDATIAAAYAQLAAAALGLGSTWVGAFDEAAAAVVVGGLRPVCILPVGHPAERPEPTSRRDLADLVHDERLPGEVVARGADASRAFRTRPR